MIEDADFEATRKFNAELRRQAARNKVTLEGEPHHADDPTPEAETKPAADWGAGARPPIFVPEDFNKVLRRAAGRIQ
jgi:hypothetical protein